MELKAVSELRNCIFTIPYQQRGYRWNPDNIQMLLNDLKEFIDSPSKKMYCLQPITVVPEFNGWAQNWCQNCPPNFRCPERFEVIDGQQRLTTLFILWKFLQLGDFYSFEFERDENNDRKRFLENISNSQVIVDDNIDFFYISQAYLTIKKWFSVRDENPSKKETKVDYEYCKLAEQESIEDVKRKFRELLKASKNEKSIQVLWYMVEKEKEHVVFRNLNSGKIQLSNSDLIKALLLNKTNDIENHQQIAAQFEIMERQLGEDRFWYMLQQKDIEPLKGQSRIDLMFNLVTGVSDEEYEIEPRKSFFILSSYTDDKLIEEWHKVRDCYQRLRDLFEDPYTFHYIGFLTYCDQKIEDTIKDYSKSKKSVFLDDLKQKIKQKRHHKSLEEYSYEDSKEVLRRLFVLHNIETLLYQYEELKEKHNLKFSYENFPFELLYNHKWNIEHIASHTDNDLKTENDRKDWIDSVFSDFPEKLSDDFVLKLKNEAERDLKIEQNFNSLYKTVVEKFNSDKPISEENKNSIGNLVLLDEHTNKSFHNSLFPRKRRIVIIASGLRGSHDSEVNVESVFVPICTQQVYTKSYNKSSNVNLNSWGQDDFDAYVSDMLEKLKFYYS